MYDYTMVYNTGEASIIYPLAFAICWSHVQVFLVAQIVGLFSL